MDSSKIVASFYILKRYFFIIINYFLLEKMEIIYSVSVVIIILRLLFLFVDKLILGSVER